MHNNPLKFVDPSGECVDTLWDVANVIYDIGKVSYGYLNNNQHAVSSGYADLGADLFALAIPGLPAGVTKAVNAAKKGLKYDPRVRVRGVEDPRSHNFPYSFDKGILNTKPSVKNNGYKIYQKKGAMIGKTVTDSQTGVQTQKYKEGVYVIGVRKDGVIDHRFFRPNK